MKILFVWNGRPHYFTRLVSYINGKNDVEVFYIYSEKKSQALGEGVFETNEGINFQLIKLEEKADPENGWLYYEGIEQVLLQIKPDIIILGETHLRPFIYNQSLRKIIDKYKIKIVLKSIPFRLRKYDDFLKEIEGKIKDLPLRPFNSIPGFGRHLLKSVKLDYLYKKLFTDRRAFRQYSKGINEIKFIYNTVDAHVNYIEEAYEIYGSYGVPKNKIFITYNSPDTDFYFSVKAKIEKEPPVLPANKFRIIHLSRLVEWKRVDMLVTAVSNLKNIFPQIELLVVGEGPEKEKLIQQAKSLGVMESIKFLGGVYDVELLGKYIMASSIYVLAGMGGLSINDAMIFGLPVICSICDGTEKYLVREGYNGLYFEDGNQESLEKKISYLFSNPGICVEMGKNSVQIIKSEVNIHTVVDRYMQAFKYVINEKG